MIDITGVDLVKFVQAVYDLSKPQGLGFMHFRTGPLSDQDAKKCLPPDGRIAVDTDYVNGRACKMIALARNHRWKRKNYYQRCLVRSY